MAREQWVTEVMGGAGGTTPTSTWWWLATDAPHTTTPVDLLHTTGTAVALLGALLLLAEVAARHNAPLMGGLKVLGAAGGMTLTLYTGHVIFMNSPLDVFAPTTGYLVQVAVALAFALSWRAIIGRGPLEALVAQASRAARTAVTPPSREDAR